MFFTDLSLNVHSYCNHADMVSIIVDKDVLDFLYSV